MLALRKKRNYDATCVRPKRVKVSQLTDIFSFSQIIRLVSFFPCF